MAKSAVTNESILDVLRQPTKAQSQDPSDTVEWNGCDSVRSLVLMPSPIAARYFEFNNYEGQRNLVQSRVTFLSNRLRLNLYHTAIIAVGILRGIKVLVNGQHSLKASIETDIMLPAMLQEYYLTSEDQLSLLFAQYDNGGIRTARHVAVAFAYGNGMTLDKEIIGQLASSLAIANWGVDSWRKTTKEDRAKNLVDHKELAEMVAALVDVDSDDDISFIRRSQVMAVIFLTLQKNVAEAKKFWKGVRDATALTQGSPQLALYKWLNKYSSNTRDVSRRVSNQLMYAQCIEGWNAFRDGRTMKRLNSGTKTFAELI